MKLKSHLVALALTAAAAAPAFGAAVVGGTVNGPDGSFSIGMNFFNDASSTVGITSIVIDGSTASPELIWDDAGTPGGTATLGSIVGVDTKVLTLAFTSFGAGTTFSLSGMDPDGDPSPASIVPSQMIGTTVTFSFSDFSTAAYRFVDDPAVGAGLVLEAIGSVPSPGGLALAGLALGLLSAATRRPRS